MNGPGLWVSWLILGARRAGVTEPRPGQGDTPWLRTACPHCTNLDTLSLHCPRGRCGWLNCTCGALIYSSTRHRHPRHRSDADTCHDPEAAA